MRAVKWLVLILVVLSLGSCDIVLNLFLKTGTVTGIVYDSTNSGVGLSGVTVTVVGTSTSTVSGSGGYFTLNNVEEGTVVLRFTRTGYTFQDVTVTVVADTTVTVEEEIVAYTVLSSGRYRFVLTWGQNPSDLDSHLYVPLSGGATYDEVYYGDKVASDSSANLDWDDTTSYGPETITITTRNTGTYYYSVYKYSGSGDIKTSGAVVKVYGSSGLIATYNASSAGGSSSDRWWRVCTLNGSTLTGLNTFSSTGK